MANITNRLDLLKFLLGAIAILLTITVIYGALFSNASVENAPVSFEEIKKESSEVTKVASKPENNANTSDNISEEESYEESRSTYIDLLEEQNTNNSLEDLSLDVENNQNEKVQTGVVIDVEDNIENEDTNAFVKNPTVVGTTPAEVAKKQNQLESDDTNIEVNSNDSLKEKAYLAKQEQLKQKQLAQQRRNEESLKKKQALEEQARLEAEKKKQLEEKKELEVKKITPLKKTTEAKVSSDPMDRINVIDRNAALSTSSDNANRYLKIGVFSTQQRAYSVKTQIQKARISLNSEQKKQIGKNFGIKIDEVDSLYHVTIGPAKNDRVLNAIKPKLATLGFRDMVIISK